MDLDADIDQEVCRDDLADVVRQEGARRLRGPAGDARRIRHRA
jgi:hypothetical protein